MEGQRERERERVRELLSYLCKIVSCSVYIFINEQNHLRCERFSSETTPCNLLGEVNLTFIF